MHMCVEAAEDDSFVEGGRQNAKFVVLGILREARQDDLPGQPGVVHAGSEVKKDEPTGYL